MVTKFFKIRAQTGKTVRIGWFHFKRYVKCGRIYKKNVIMVILIWGKFGILLTLFCVSEFLCACFSLIKTNLKDFQENDK